MVAGQPSVRGGVAGANGSLQGTGLPAEVVDVRMLWQVQGWHGGLLSSA
jgi:hypothetical protein